MVGLCQKNRGLRDKELEHKKLEHSELGNWLWLMKAKLKVRSGVGLLVIYAEKFNAKLKKVLKKLVF